MKSKVFGDRLLLECTCGDPEHLLAVDVIETDELDFSKPAGLGNEYIYGADFYFMSSWRSPWSKRVVNAFKYIFINKPYCVHDVVFLTEKNLDCLQELVDTFRKQSKLSS